MEFTARVVDTQTLSQLADSAASLGFNRQLPAEFVEQLDPDGVHVLVPLLEHRHRAGVLLGKDQWHIRCHVFAKPAAGPGPELGVLDVLGIIARELPEVPESQVA